MDFGRAIALASAAADGLESLAPDAAALVSGKGDSWGVTGRTLEVVPEVLRSSLLPESAGVSRFWEVGLDIGELRDGT